MDSTYRTQENFGGKKIWQISIKGGLATNILTNSAHLKIQFKVQRTCACVWCVEMAIFTFSVEAMIRGYNEYMHIWESPSSTDHLLCQREIGNPHNTHAVAVKGNIVGLDDTTTVGHIPNKISAICSIFIRCGRTCC